MTLRYNSTEKLVYKLVLCKPNGPITIKLPMRLLIKNFPNLPIFEDDEVRSFFYGVSRSEIRCKDAARRVYLKPAKNATPITPIFKDLILAETYMNETYGNDWVDRYSVVYVYIDIP